MDALQKLKQKLKSQTGASITFALLLFLVCAVVGSAVLVAGTAAAGRMSKIAEMDQRYYAVNSAARLLVETIEKETVTIVKTNSLDSSDGSGGNTSSGQEGTSGAGGAANEKQSFPRDAAKKLGILDGTGSDLSSPTEFTLSIKDADSDVKDSIEVKISETITPDGSMIFVVSKGKNNDVYALKLSFELDRQDNTELNLQKNTETTTTVLDWRLTDIETVSNIPTPTATQAGTGG